MNFYDDHHTELQEQFESRDLAQAMEFAIVQSELNDEAGRFIEQREFFFLSTVRSDGQPTVSHKGGAPGFVRVTDPSTIVFPSYDGNGMFFSMGNIAATAKIGMLFIDFETPHRVRVHADATVSTNDPLIDDFPGAQLLVRATVTESFINCPRYIVKHQRIEASRYVPDKDGMAPIAAWKKMPDLQPFLRPADQAAIEKSGESLTHEEYGELLRRGET
ncbi:MAG: pyridoxamine 5'-phosphate oxidase family protein [Acidimicrobiales bacterium]|nr:pyridoxamine 5'-phosphate oxidase family protein [Acidimicrobiales bacterium]MDG2219367.1 pyridoxamine 5'-phosphate oxidase family protein [Acidimicrobiales bacterium]